MGLFDFFKKDDDKLFEETNFDLMPKAKPATKQSHVQDMSIISKPKEVIDNNLVKENVPASQLNAEKGPMVGLGKDKDDKTDKKPDAADEDIKSAFYGHLKKHVIRPKKNVIIFGVENSFKVIEYRETVSKIISKIMDENKDSIFSVFRMGYLPKYFGLLPYDMLQKSGVKERLLKGFEESDKKTNIYEVLKYIKYIINSHKTAINSVEIAEQTYEITGYNIVFIGTANFENTTNELSSEILKELKSDEKIKSIKYFCIDDKNTINAAAIGFPIIGHIESNFYK